MAMTPVAIHPSQRNRGLITCSPIVCGRDASSIMTTMMGTAITPLSTADQNSSFTGSVGVKHRITPPLRPRHCIDPDAQQVPAHLAPCRHLLARGGVFHFLRGLPEEQVGADGGTQYRLHHQQGVMVECDIGEHDTPRYRAPVHVHHERHRHVRQQRQGQPFEPADVGAVRHEHLQHQA